MSAHILVGARSGERGLLQGEIEMFASSVIQVMIDASDPVRGPHRIRVSGQEKEIQGGMVGKKRVTVPRVSSLACRERVILGVRL